MHFSAALATRSTGIGEFMDVLAEHDILAEGIAPDIAFTRYLSRRGHAAHTGPVMDALKHLEDVSYDGVFGHHVLYHHASAKSDQIIQKCKRVLKPGGILVLVLRHPAAVGNCDGDDSPGHAHLHREVMQTLGIGPANLVVSMIARFSRVKGSYDFIHAAYRIKQRMPNVKFVMVGGAVRATAYFQTW
ncbi:MAG: methyltransferase domain-containing protein, partial [Candidatus Poribacteria bacterium]|nr:methyltransferase domain-containing protein [Candidatus Poribacteria bacterium]